MAFLSPFKGGRRVAREEVERQLNIVFRDNPGVPVNVIAHSFGTYLITEILRLRSDRKFHRIIFAGSVLKRQVPLEDYSTRFTPKILNEVGDQDQWPAFAESLTWWFGAGETVGLRTPLVRDRFHANAGHNFYLNRLFCRDFWLPFLKDGTVNPPTEAAKGPALWVRLLLIFQIKYLVLVLAALLALSLPDQGRTFYAAAIHSVVALVGVEPDIDSEGFAYFETDAQGRLTPTGRLERFRGIPVTIDKVSAGDLLQAHDDMQVRQAPSSENSPVLLTLYKGQCVQVAAGPQALPGTFGGWLPVTRAECPGPSSGWVWAGYLGKVGDDSWAVGPFLDIVKPSESLDRPLPFRNGDLVRPEEVTS